jgi:hypothetical protein
MIVSELVFANAGGGLTEVAGALGRRGDLADAVFFLRFATSAQF